MKETMILWETQLANGCHVVGLAQELAMDQTENFITVNSKASHTILFLVMITLIFQMECH
ncbi:hypothetical protein [Lactobacillus phage Bassarid]|nr:hypothetical protein [Lactobacillus phage Bassarid]